MFQLYMKRPLEKKVDAPLEARAEPPVVARLVVEIRSDGTHTIARGMAEDVAQGERVQIEAQGSSPLELALSLIKALREVPSLARSFARGLLPARKK
jgi:hypothetical protein